VFYRYKPRFFDAFRRAMTRPRNTPYPNLTAWALKTRDLVRDVIVAANASGFDEGARRALIIHLDRRDVSAETLLATVRFHAADEYPYLLGQPLKHNVLAVYAANLNDRYAVLRLCEHEALQAEPLHARLLALRQHLDDVPPQG
jgi:hypothetical protein